MKQVQTDIVIVSAGAAGLAASVAAAEGGAKVIAFEKANTTGGTGNMGMGPLGVESRLQRIKQIDLTREKAFKIFMDYTHWRVDARLVKAYIDKSASTIDWLEGMGVEFVDPAAYFPGSNFTWHIVKPEVGRPGPQASATMMKRLTERAKALGVQFYLQTPVKKIIKEKGVITGVIAEDNTGEQIQAKAKAVIIATGGFGDSPELIKKNTGYEWGKDLFSTRIPGLTGDGIRMAWEMGGAQGEMNIEMTYGVPGQQEAAVTNAFRQPNMAVNLQGERFMNEEIMGNTTFTGNAISKQKNRSAFIIFDNDTKKYYEDVGLDFLSLVHVVMKMENFDDQLNKLIAQGYPNVFSANTVEELADKTGINKPNLVQTVNEYNTYCESGRDLLFNKNARYLRAIKNPKYYAARLFPSGYGSLGGIKINYKCEVITKDFDAIPGLYGAGTDANSLYGDSYVFVLPGNTMGFAVNSGRIAAESAIQYIKTIK